MAKEAKPADAEKANAKEKSGSGKGLLIALVLLTPLGGGGGYLFATQAVTPPKAPAVEDVAKPQEDAKHGDGHGEEKAKAEHEKMPPSGELIALPTIVTNLAPPGDPFIRIEGSIVVEPEYPDGKILAAKVSEDIVALLRTIPLSQLQGAAGLLHLREDIIDRVKIRSENKASDLIIHSLVIE